MPANQDACCKTRYPPNKDDFLRRAHVDFGWWGEAQTREHFLVRFVDTKLKNSSRGRKQAFSVEV